MTSSRLPVLSALLLAGTVALAGCSMSAPTASAVPAGTASAAAQPGDATKACTLVSVAQAQGAIRSTPAITQQQPGSFVHGEPECGYASDDGQTIVVNVTIWPDTSGFDLQHAVVSDNALTPVSGVGDKAAAGPIELDAIVGSRGISVESFGTTDVTGDQLVAMAKLVVAGLR
jgi:hypothetical protein